MTDEEKKGVEAIIYLQKFAGIDESKEKALAGWQQLSKTQQDSTMATFRMLGGERKEAAL